MERGLSGWLPNTAQIGGDGFLISRECEVFSDLRRVHLPGSQLLAVLDDTEKRGELAEARTHDDLRKSIAWNEIRDLSGPFHDGLVALFLEDDEDLKTLTMKYGLF